MRRRSRMMSSFAASAVIAIVLSCAAPSMAAEANGGQAAAKVLPSLDRHHVRARVVAYRPVRPYSSWRDLGWLDFWCGRPFVLMTGIAY